MVFKWLFVILFGLTVSASFSQSWVTKTRNALPSEDILSELSAYQASSREFLFYNDSSLVFENILGSYFSKVKSYKSTTKSSALLNELCRQTILNRNQIRSNKRSSHRSNLRKLGRVLLGTIRSYGMVDYFYFEIAIVKTGTQYFYDEEGGDSPYHLYRGDKPSKEQLEEEYKYKACEILTEEMIQKKIESKIKGSRLNKFILRKEVATVGFASCPKKGTLRKKGTPTIQVLVMVGIKRIDEKKMTSGRYKTQLKHVKQNTEEELKNFPELLKN